MDGTSASAYNSGEIVGSFGIYIAGENNDLPSSMSVTNTGTINSENYGIYAGLDLASSALTIKNSGTISGNYYSLLLYDSPDTVTNTGTLNGDVLLGGGNDVFDSRSGTVNGIVNGGLGADTYFTNDHNLRIVETGIDTDTVNAATSYRLGDNVENLTLLGANNFNGFGNSANNALFGNAGDNRLVGLEGSDRLVGDLGDDRLVGGLGADSLDGGDGDDVLLGNVGNDTLRGFEGDDRLTGAAGLDLLFGSGGADTFLFTARNQSGATNATSNDAFTFIGTAALTAAGQLHYVQTGGNTFVEMEVNGVAGADIIIRLDGPITLTAADFAL